MNKTTFFYSFSISVMVLLLTNALEKIPIFRSYTGLSLHVVHWDELLKFLLHCFIFIQSIFHSVKWLWNTLTCTIMSHMPHSRALHFVWQWQKCSRQKHGYVPNNGLQVIIHFLETFVLFYYSRHFISFIVANSVGCNRTHLRIICLGTTTSTLEYHSS